MPCITPNHDIAVILDEDGINLVVARFHQQRPQFFRRISKGMDGLTPFDKPLDPFVIGETGHSIEYEFNVTAPADGKFVDLFPATDPRTNASAARGELLIKCGLLIRLWDRQPGKRWQFELPLTALCAPVATAQHVVLDARGAFVSALVPPPFQNAVNYASLNLLKSALKRLTVPGNFFVDPPANARFTFEGLPIENDRLEVDAAVSF